jgi:hypothetical protein
MHQSPCPSLLQRRIETKQHTRVAGSTIKYSTMRPFKELLLHRLVIHFRCC